jgi:hypothetical protein
MDTGSFFSLPGLPVFNFMLQLPAFFSVSQPLAGFPVVLYM